MSIHASIRMADLAYGPETQLSPCNAIDYGRNPCPTYNHDDLCPFGPRCLASWPVVRLGHRIMSSQALPKTNVAASCVPLDMCAVPLAVAAPGSLM